VPNLFLILAMRVPGNIFKASGVVLWLEG